MASEHSRTRPIVEQNVDHIVNRTVATVPISMDLGYPSPLCAANP
jgi:hypothetical protein